MKPTNEKPAIKGMKPMPKGVGKKGVDMPKGGKPWTAKSDAIADKKAGIKPGSKKDDALDKKRGVPVGKKK